MKNFILCSVLHGLLLVVLAADAGEDAFCSWSTRNIFCLKSEFRCLNREKCIRRQLYCNGVNDCGDNSDEKYCNVGSCPGGFKNCGYWSSLQKCFPAEWFCNGYQDCSNEHDENNCKNSDASESTAPTKEQSRRAVDKVKKWIEQQRNDTHSTKRWGSYVHRLSLITYYTSLMSNKKFDTSQLHEMEMAYELNIQLLSYLSSVKLEDIPSTELASYINAFLVMCINPRNFHGYDIIAELRKRIDQEIYTNPYVLLALCNAGENMTEFDKEKLMDTFENKHRTIWAGTQAVAIMALACADKQPGNEVDSEKLHEMMSELKQQQHTNGTVVNLPTTALVLQALISIDSERDRDKFDEIKAIQQVFRNQNSDGSFGDSMITFFVTPILTCKSLVDINSDHCHYENGDENSALEKLSRTSGSKIRVHYSIWIGEKKDIERNLVLRVPQNMSLYGVMEIAAEVDSRFQFEYAVKDRKPYIDAISGMRDNPLTGKFWFLYFVQDGKTILSSESPADIIPKDKEHYAMWYRRGSWVE